MNAEDAVDFVVLVSEKVRYKFPVEVLEEIEDELKVRWLGSGGFCLPNKQFVEQFVEQYDIVMIPKAALFTADDEVSIGPIN